MMDKAEMDETEMEAEMDDPEVEYSIPDVLNDVRIASGEGEIPKYINLVATMMKKEGVGRTRVTKVAKALVSADVRTGSDLFRGVTTRTHFRQKLKHLDDKVALDWLWEKQPVSGKQRNKRKSGPLVLKGPLKKNGKFMRTETGYDLCPSDFSKSAGSALAFEGVGYMEANDFDPTFGIIKKALCPQPKDSADPLITQGLKKLSAGTGIIPLVGFVPHQELPETGMVQEVFEKNTEFLGFRGRQLEAAKVSYSLYNAPGLASGKGSVDGVLSSISIKPYERLVLGVWENKGTAASLLSTGRQAGLGYAFNIATSLFGLGMKAKDILVPVVCCSGRKIQFGVVYVLEPSFPVYANISKELDLRDGGDAKRAALHVQKIQSQQEEMKKKVKELKSYIDLSTTDLQADFSELTVDLNANLENPADCQYFLKLVQNNGYSGLMNIFAALQNSDANEYVAFPRAIRNGDAKTKNNPCIIFDNLCHAHTDGGPYQCGLPEVNDYWEDYLRAIQAAMWCIHKKAEVAHVDSYPSNFMYRVRDDEISPYRIEIKIIDWDESGKIGYTWSKEVKKKMERLREKRERLGWKFFDKVDAGWDLNYVKVLVTIKDDDVYKKTRKALSDASVDKINSAFRSVADSVDIGGTELLYYRKCERGATVNVSGGAGTGS